MYSDMVVSCCGIQFVYVVASFWSRWNLLHGKQSFSFVPLGLSRECLNIKIAITSKQQIRLVHNNMDHQTVFILVQHIHIAGQKYYYHKYQDNLMSQEWLEIIEPYK